MRNKRGPGNIVPMLNNSGGLIRSGGVVVMGSLVGIATGDHPNLVVQDCDLVGLFDLPVTDTVGGGINAGDPITCTLATGQISNTAVGAGVVPFGYALGAVPAGGAAVIQTLKVM